MRPPKKGRRKSTARARELKLHRGIGRITHQRAADTKGNFAARIKGGRRRCIKEKSGHNARASVRINFSQRNGMGGKEKAMTEEIEEARPHCPFPLKLESIGDATQKDR